MAAEFGKWVFMLTDASRWEWRHLSRGTGAELARAAETFATLHVCIANAQRHGYMLPNQNGLPTAATRQRHEARPELRAMDC